jgi:hypothetical protein
MIIADMGVNPTPWGHSPYDEIIEKLVATGIRRHAFGIPDRPAFHGRCLDARTNRAVRYRLTVAMTLTVPSRDSFLTRGIQSLRRSDFMNQYSST